MIMKIITANVIGQVLLTNAVRGMVVITNDNTEIEKLIDVLHTHLEHCYCWEDVKYEVEQWLKYPESTYWYFSGSDYVISPNDDYGFAKTYVENCDELVGWGKNIYLNLGFSESLALDMSKGGEIGCATFNDWFKSTPDAEKKFVDALIKHLHSLGLSHQRCVENILGCSHSYTFTFRGKSYSIYNS